MVAGLRIDIPREQLADFCKRWKIIELAVFGSVLRDDFRPDSDVDVLVTFADGARWSLFDIVDMEDQLKELFGREVDLSERCEWRRAKITFAAGASSSRRGRSMSRDDAFLLDVLIAARKIVRNTDGSSLDEFIGNELLQDAVMRQIQIIGEAAGRISQRCAKRIRISR